ncbi:hypothetical protein D3C80_2165350 [compost metagenome]
MTADVVVAGAILEAAEVRIVHQADVAGLRAFDDDQVVLVQLLALVNEFHRGFQSCLRNGTRR